MYGDSYMETLNSLSKIIDINPLFFLKKYILKIDLFQKKNLLFCVR
jgi:hypothetical protein